MSTHDDDDNSVGYGRPPKASQFKKGQSGNPRGRPRGAKGMAASLKRELAARITIKEGRQEQKVSKAEAAAKRLVAKALGGDMRALAKLVELDPLLFGPGSEEASLNRSAQPEAVDFDILRHFFGAEGGAPSNDDDGDIATDCEEEDEP